MWNTAFVVVGMSFECEVDRYLLSALQRVEDDVPIGESTWILVNPDPSSLKASGDRIQAALPFSRQLRVPLGFDDWLHTELRELHELGAIAA
jgi:hypothetical protein